MYVQAGTEAKEDHVFTFIVIATLWVVLVSYVSCAVFWSIFFTFKRFPLLHVCDHETPKRNIHFGMTLEHFILELAANRSHWHNTFKRELGKEAKYIFIIFLTLTKFQSSLNHLNVTVGPFFASFKCQLKKYSQKKCSFFPKRLSYSYKMIFWSISWSTI